MTGGSNRLDIERDDAESAQGADVDVASDAQFESFLAALASSPPPHRPPLLVPGDVFADRYRVERELGRGGMGTVYLATDLELGRKVALKTALGRRAEAELERLQHEATIMAGLSHPGIVTIFEATTAGDDVYITLEFVPGGTLRDWIDLRERRWREAASLFVEIADTLFAAHEAGVVHRDFKPANVLLGLEGRPRIADFGLARSGGPLDTQEMGSLQSSTATRTGAVMGTPAYMAPEQARGEAATSAADQFSFFVSLYEAICRRRPFSGKTLLELLDCIEAGPPEACPGMPRALAEVVRRGLGFEPSRRYPDMGAVARDLRRVLNHRKRRLQFGGLTLGVMAAASLGYVAAPKVEPPCQEDPLSASIDRLWNASTRAQLDTRGGETTRSLDGYRDDLVERRIAACEAHTVHSDLSDTDFALRTACLDRAEARLAGLIDDLLASQRDIPDARAFLPDPDDCTNTVALRRYTNAFASTSSLDDTEQDLANARAIRILTRAKLQALRGEDFSPLARQVITLADENGLATLEAEALLLLSSIETSTLETEHLLDQAVAAAGDDPPPEFLANVAVQRGSQAVASGELRLARVHLAHAESLARLAAAPEEQDRLDRDLLRQRIAVAARDTADAVSEIERILLQLPKQDLRRGFTQRLLADALQDRNRLGEAEKLYAQLLAGPYARDPFLRLELNINRAVSLRRQGRAADAAAAIEAGRASYREPLTDDVEGTIRIAEGAVAILQGQLDLAEERLRGAEELLSSVDPEYPLLGDVWYHQARIALARGEHRDAFDKTNAALALWDRLHGPGSADASRALTLMSRAVLELGHHEPAAEAAKVAAGFLRELSRPADEVALAELAQARAEGTANPEARRSCETSELVACREALAAEAASALSP